MSASAVMAARTCLTAPPPNKMHKDLVMNLTRTPSCCRDGKRALLAVASTRVGWAGATALGLAVAAVALAARSGDKLVTTANERTNTVTSLGRKHRLFNGGRTSV